MNIFKCFRLLHISKVLSVSRQSTLCMMMGGLRYGLVFIYLCLVCRHIWLVLAEELNETDIFCITDMQRELYCTLNTCGISTLSMQATRNKHFPAFLVFFEIVLLHFLLIQ